MESYKVGVVGFGYWGKNQARVFNELGCLHGIYDVSNDLIKDEYSNYFFYDSLENLIENVDALVICTPAETHFKIASLALNKGKDILVEKPIAMNMAEVSSLMKIEKENNCIVMVGHQLHFHPAIKKLKKLVNDNEIGNIKWIYSNRLNMGKIRPYENVLWSFAPHDISLILEFTGNELESINVQATNVLNNKIEDTTLTYLNFKNGIKAHIFVSWIHPFKEQRFVVVGDKGSIVFSDTEEVDKLKLYKTDISLKGTITNHTNEVVELNKNEPLKEQAAYFLQSIHNRKIKINNSSHAFDVVSILEKSTDIIKTSS